MDIPNVTLVVDPDGPTPLYVQVADLIAAEIADGTLPPNRPIPSEATLKQRYGIARGTARRAVEELRQRGLVVTVPGKGSFVRP